MQSEFGSALAILERHISPYNARLLLQRALEEQGFRRESLTRSELRRCRTSLARGIALFVAATRREAALAELEAYCGADSIRPGGIKFHVMFETDIARVRGEARHMCDALGATAFTMQRVATIVSELARNQVLYANGGVIEILATNHGRKNMTVRASDNGPGIANLDQVLAGRHKSKTGLGRGILGTKRLADRFDISTGSEGTHIVAEVFL